jgi:hypothetical protein
MPPTPLRSGGGLIAFDMALSSLRSKPAFAPRHGQTRQVAEAGSARSGTGKIRLAARTRKNLRSPSQTAAVLGKLAGCGGYWGPGCVPSGMWCVPLLEPL